MSVLSTFKFVGSGTTRSVATKVVMTNTYSREDPLCPHAPRYWNSLCGYRAATSRSDRNEFPTVLEFIKSRISQSVSAFREVAWVPEIPAIVNIGNGEKRYCWHFLCLSNLDRNNFRPSNSAFFHSVFPFRTSAIARVLFCCNYSGRSHFYIAHEQLLSF
jgi:hypothetical protein